MSASPRHGDPRRRFGPVGEPEPKTTSRIAPGATISARAIPGVPPENGPCGIPRAVELVAPPYGSEKDASHLFSVLAPSGTRHQLEALPIPAALRVKIHRTHSPKGGCNNQNISPMSVQLRWIHRSACSGICVHLHRDTQTTAALPRRYTFAWSAASVYTLTPAFMSRRISAGQILPLREFASVNAQIKTSLFLNGRSRDAPMPT